MKIQSAIDRYSNEIERVLGVLESHLTTGDHACLVGSTISYADLMWVPWNDLVPSLMGSEYSVAAKFPAFHAWHEKLKSRDGVQKMIAARAAALAENS